jgi:hypothetical protein
VSQSVIVEVEAYKFRPLTWMVNFVSQSSVQRINPI